MSKITIKPAALDKMKKGSKTYTLYMASRGGWGGCVVTPAVQAGIPVAQDDYEKTEIEGIPFFIRKDMADKNYEINWVGFWVLGQFVVNEI